MTEFVFGPYRLEVDVEATRAWYDRYGDATGGCDCAYCRNFAAAVGTLPPEVEAFLEPLGLSLRRPGEIGEYGPRRAGGGISPCGTLRAACWRRGRGSCPSPPASPPGSPRIWGLSSGTSRSPASSAGSP